MLGILHKVTRYCILKSPWPFSKDPAPIPTYYISLYNNGSSSGRGEVMFSIVFPMKWMWTLYESEIVSEISMTWTVCTKQVFQCVWNEWICVSECVCMNSLIFIFLILFIQLLYELLAFISSQKDLAFENESVPEWGSEMDLPLQGRWLFLKTRWSFLPVLVALFFKRLLLVPCHDF